MVLVNIDPLDPRHKPFTTSLVLSMRCSDVFLSPWDALLYRNRIAFRGSSFHNVLDRFGLCDCQKLKLTKSSHFCIRQSTACSIPKRPRYSQHWNKGIQKPLQTWTLSAEQVGNHLNHTKLFNFDADRNNLFFSFTNDIFNHSLICGQQ